jgi:hypothetical protein
LTTNRPYQQAHTPEQALQIIQNLAGKRLDPVPVAALLAVYGRGEIRIQRFSIKRPVNSAPPASVEPPSLAPMQANVLPASVTSETASETAALERTRV